MNELRGRHQTLRRIRRNAGTVISGNVLAAILGVITVALNARALGATGLGVLALVLTIARLVDRILAFQTWQPLVKLGAEAIDAGDSVRVGQLVLVALMFDALAAVSAALVAIVIVLFAGELLGLPGEYLGVAAIYMATLVTRVADAPAGILRLFDRFGLLTAVRVGEAAGICLVAAVLFVLEASLVVYVLCFAVVAVGANIALLFYGLRVGYGRGVSLARTKIASAWHAVWREFWAFSWAMSLTAITDVIRERTPVLLIGAVLGPALVGIYYMAERIASVVGMVMWPIHQALFPESARLAASRRIAEMRWFVTRVGLIGAGFGLVVLLGTLAMGHMVLLVIGGPEFYQAYWPLALLIAGYCFALAGIGLRSAVAVTSGPRVLLVANLIAFVPFLLAVAPATIIYGITGAAAMQVIFWSLWLIVMTVHAKVSLASAMGKAAPHTMIEKP